MLVLSLVIAASTTTAPSSEITLEYLSERLIQPQGEYQGSRVGGISGVDYEPISDRWVMVSDARGEHAPTRAYEFGVLIDDDKIRKFQILGKLGMHHGDGTLFDALRYDPESVRLRPAHFFDGDDEGDPTMIWVSEGSRAHSLAPTIYEACMGATWMDQWEPPAYFTQESTSGTRDNLGYESLALLPDGSAIVATEEPLAQDGPPITAGVSGPVRLLHFNLDIPLSPAMSEWVYMIDPPAESLGPLARNGLVELVAIDDTRLIALERGFNPLGTFNSRLYLVELEGATDVSGTDSLQSADLTPVRKTLISDLSEVRDTFGRPVPPANYEGITIGPELSDGRRIIMLVSDNNFHDRVPTRMLFLAASGLD